MSVAAFLAVGIGGAFGALCRSKATSFLKPRFPGRFPLPTLFINLLSCTSAGALMAFQIQLDGIVYLALTMGFAYNGILGRFFDPFNYEFRSC